MDKRPLGEFLAATREAKKIAVVDLGFLGDTVHLIPSLWELKSHYSQAALHVLTSPVGGEVLSMAPCVDRVWTTATGSGPATWRRHLGLLRQARREQFDAAYSFSGADRALIFTGLLGARHQVVCEDTRRHFWTRWLVEKVVPRQPRPVLVYEAHRQLLARCGFDLGPVRFNLVPPGEEREWAKQRVPAGAVHLSLGATHPLREWPLEHFAGLIRNLLAAETGRKLVVTAAPNAREQARLAEFRRLISSPELIVPDEHLSLARLTAVLERCALHVGSDSGVLHLAVALNLATVSLFRSSPGMTDWAPVGPRHRQMAVACPCLQSGQETCTPANGPVCLAGIEPAAVAAAVRQLLEQTRRQ